MHIPTPEQSAAAAAFPTGSHLVIQAGAGTGKTTTLAMLARTARRQGRSGRYIAFNRAVARHAARTFPAEVSCGTAHALAYTAVGRRYQARMNAPRQAGWRTGAALGIDEDMTVRIGARKMTNKALSYTVLRTVTRFCQSADSKIAPHHVPPLRGAESAPLHAQLADLVLTYARRAWADLQHPDRGVVRFEHDHYLKMWALRAPSSRRTSCCWTRRRTPTPWSSRSSPRSAITHNWCWSETRPRPSTAGAARATS